jgi:hypothetical protein
MQFYHRASIVINQGVPIYKIRELGVVNELNRMKNKIENTKIEEFDVLVTRIDEELNGLVA